jgi:hypothetical protein
VFGGGAVVLFAPVASGCFLACLIAGSLMSIACRAQALLDTEAA